MSYCPPGHRCVRTPPQPYLYEVGAYGARGSGGPPPENSVFSRCEFLYSGAFLGWPAGEGQYLNLFRFRTSHMPQTLKRWQTQQLSAGILIMKSESSRLELFIHLFIHLCHLSHISLINIAQLLVSLHLHLTPSLVWFVFKPVRFSLSLLVRLFSSKRLLCLFPSPCVCSWFVLVVFWFVLTFVFSLPAFFWVEILDLSALMLAFCPFTYLPLRASCIWVHVDSLRIYPSGNLLYNINHRLFGNHIVFYLMINSPKNDSDSVIIYSSPCQWKVGWSVVLHKVFLEIQMAPYSLSDVILVCGAHTLNEWSSLCTHFRLATC